MGQHLHLYATKDIPEKAVKAWIDYRSHDLDERPGLVAQKVEREMRRVERSSTDEQHFEDGPHITEAISDLFVWKVFPCTEETLLAAMRAAPNDGPIHDWLKVHIGWLIWGDNDGI